jgi:hypothetical protein
MSWTLIPIISNFAGLWEVWVMQSSRFQPTELPKGLAAVALNPGIIDTRMLRSRSGEAASGHPRL